MSSSQLISKAKKMLRERRMPDFGFWISRAYKDWRWDQYNMISVVSENPAIIYTGAFPTKLARHLQPLMAGRPLTIFYRAGWSLEDDKTRTERLKSISDAQKLFPEHRYILAANTSREVELVAGSGVHAESINESAFVDENSFFPLEAGEPEFDAVLDAQIATYKRLQLAAKVPNLLVITYLLASRYDDDYADLVRKALSGATWANNPYWEESYRRLSREEVAACYRNSRVGLCLSAIEGANLASIQYLLSGIPVVSTISSGGRDEFYSPEYATVVEPDADAVADAVEAFLKQRPDPAVIRQKTLEKIYAIRNHFADLIQKYCGHPPVSAEWWKDFTLGRPVSYQNLKSVGRRLRRAAR